MTDPELVPPSEVPLPGKDKPRVLTPQEIRRLGALQVEEERSEGLEAFLAEQRACYEQPALTKQDLVEALVTRDRQLALEGREAASGRLGARLLREFVRGVLTLADHQTLRAVGDGTKAGHIEQILQALGAEPSDLRQVQRHGSMLGPESEALEQKAAEWTKAAAGPAPIDKIGKP